MNILMTMAMPTVVPIIMEADIIVTAIITSIGSVDMADTSDAAVTEVVGRKNRPRKGFFPSLGGYKTR